MQDSPAEPLCRRHGFERRPQNDHVQVRPGQGQACSLAPKEVGLCVGPPQGPRHVGQRRYDVRHLWLVVSRDGLALRREVGHLVVEGGQLAGEGPLGEKAVVAGPFGRGEGEGVVVRAL